MGVRGLGGSGWGGGRTIDHRHVGTEGAVGLGGCQHAAIFTHIPVIRNKL